MRILFVKPNMGLVDGRPYQDRGRMEPLTFAVLAGFTPDEHDLHLCDDRFEAVPWSGTAAGGWDLVGINVEVYTARRAYEIADRFRAAGVKVVLGGCHVTLAPDEAAAHADAIALGDLDAGWREVVSDAAARRLRARYVAPRAARVTGVRTRWEIFRGKRYLPIALTQLSRGCHGTCEYCATGSQYRGALCLRPVDEVVEELRRHGRRLVFFVDDNVVSDRAAALALFRALRPLRLRWTGQASVAFAGDPELLDAMMESGCAGLVVGFESRDPANLAAMNKRSNLAFGSYDLLVERMRAAGLMVWAAFLLGYDHETPASIRETLAWALSKRFAFSAFNVLTPYPGTPFYERMRAEGRLRFGGRWWLHDDYRFGDVAFEPRHMGADELSALGLECRLRHASPWQILRRATDRRTNSKDLWSLATYLAYNPLFRGEMLKKHGMTLGYRGTERA